MIYKFWGYMDVFSVSNILFLNLLIINEIYICMIEWIWNKNNTNMILESRQDKDGQKGRKTYHREILYSINNGFPYK